MNPRPMKHSYKTKTQRKAQKDHIEEEKTTKTANGMKNDKPSKITKLKTPPEINSA
jgi:hypothetical protein